MNAEELRELFTVGLTYSTGIMAILGAHELGHYLQARRYGVPASFPYFIPFPISPFGTMGAVIVQQSGTADRKSMFDIAISGRPVEYLGGPHDSLPRCAVCHVSRADAKRLNFETWHVEPQCHDCASTQLREL